MDKITRDLIEANVRKLKKMSSLVDTFTGRCDKAGCYEKGYHDNAKLYVRKGDLFVKYDRCINVIIHKLTGAYGPPFEWPEFIYHKDLSVKVRDTLVLHTDFAWVHTNWAWEDNYMVYTYVPGKWEKTFEELFSSEQSVEKGKKAFDAEEVRLNKRSDLAKRRSEKKAKMEELANIFGITKRLV